MYDYNDKNSSHRNGKNIYKKYKDRTAKKLYLEHHT
jgi:hypothetical protein